MLELGAAVINVFKHIERGGGGRHQDDAGFNFLCFLMCCNDGFFERFSDDETGVVIAFCELVAGFTEKDYFLDIRGL